MYQEGFLGETALFYCHCAPGAFTLRAYIHFDQTMAAIYPPQSSN
jgi:hypothetical protein